MTANALPPMPERVVYDWEGCTMTPNAPGGERLRNMVRTDGME